MIEIEQVCLCKHEVLLVKVQEKWNEYNLNT